MSFPRSSGILLHPTSLPGPNGIGELGPEAYRFADFLRDSGQRIWQVLPLGPTGYGDSPYQCFSAFAGNPLLISLDVLVERGYLNLHDIDERPNFPADNVDFGAVIAWKLPLLRKALSGVRAQRSYRTRRFRHVLQQAFSLAGRVCIVHGVEAGPQQRHVDAMGSRSGAARTRRASNAPAANFAMRSSAPSSSNSNSTGNGTT